ncbi:protein broad-minded [Biomphalaria glabrata]|nr:protein broad-minded [Biomphalaria glabrata]
MTMRGLEGDDLKRSLKELIISWEPIIRDTESFDQAEDRLVHLEENDENFHKHDFVKALKRKLEEILSPLIEEEPERNSMAGHIDSHESQVNSFIDRIIESKEFTDFKLKLGKNMNDAVETLLASFNESFNIGRLSGDAEGVDPLKTPMITDDEEVSSFNSLYDQGSVMLFNQDYLKTIAENLSKTKNPSVRKEAMQKLNQLISGEIVHNKYWVQLRKNLLDILADPDEQISELSFKFIAKSFSHASHYTSQVYVLLTDFLNTQFKSTSMNFVSKGLDFTNKFTVKLLKAFRLMVEFQQEAPNYWVRYPLTYMDEIVQSTLNLITLQPAPSQQSRLMPLHFVAVLDPKALWFTKWMHGNYCRSELLKHLKQYKVIVETSVKYCMGFSNTHRVSHESLSQISEEFSKISIKEEDKRLYYTGAELEYILLMHSLHFIGCLLLYEKGRALFPIKLKDRQAPVSVFQLLKALVPLIRETGEIATNKKSNAYRISSLVTEVLKSLCSTETICSICFCKDEIMQELLSPVEQYLDEAPDQLPSETTLLHIADILCVIATSTNGRRQLLYGEGKELLSENKSSSSAYLIAKFTRKALLNKFSNSSLAPSNAVTGAYLYVCRQLYNTCEGLFLLSQYELHKCIVDVWNSLQKEKQNTASSFGKLDKETYMDLWSATLQDNLLNFASTAKGILLLHQTGAFNECVRYMYSRYEKKLQVSKCEKFGYGVMVTQVAATAAGIQALQSTGYIKALLVELWSSLECGPQDVPVFTPKSWPIDPVDRSSQKHFVRLVNILSAFPAVYELLKGEPLPSKEVYSLREIPESIMALIDRLIIVDSSAKIHSLFNYEQSHTFGLRLLSVMVSCLDTFLLIESQYKFQEFLLQEQEMNRVEESDFIIVDVLSLERNYILVKTFLIGGPSERTLPLRSLENDRTEIVKPPTLFSSYPIPKEYQPNIAGRAAGRQDNELSKFLSSPKADKKPKVWLDKCRDLFVKTLVAGSEHSKGHTLVHVMEQVVDCQSHMQEEAVFHLFDFTGTESAIKNYKLSPLQTLGIKVAIRYGIHLKVISASSESTENLTRLMKLTGCFLKQQMKSLKSSLRFLEGTYPGFDWFTATIFLMYNGNTEKAWHFLHHLSALGTSGYIWMARLHAALLPNNILSSGMSPLFSSTAHNIELLLQTELPLVVSAFKMSGYTPSQICMHWLTQCFWNYLDWLDIMHYVVICVVLGVDYQIYLCVAILKHLQENILSHMQDQDLVIFLMEEPIKNFHPIDEIKYMKQLEKKYRKIVLPDMMNISKP